MTSPLWSISNATLAGRVLPRLAEVTLSIPHGITAIIGDSGAGKTSLLHLLTGFEVPTEGTVQFHGDASDRLACFAAPQDDGLWPGVTVIRHLELVAPTPDASQVELLEDFDLLPLHEVTPESLSRGEAGRLAIARALAANARVLILDEPLSHVDSTNRGLYWDRLIDHCQRQQTSLVFASHEPADILRYAEHVIVVQQGNISFVGTTRDLYHNPSNETLAGLLGPVNWFDPTDQAVCPALSHNAKPCVRPERLVLESTETGDWQVLKTRSAGLYHETDLRHFPSQTDRRVVHQATQGQVPLPGARVRLLLGILLCGAFLAGCDGGGHTKTLEVESIDVFALPADGARLPAPRDIAVGEQGEWIVLDNAGRVLVYRADGSLDRQWRMPDSADGNPEGACLLSDGRIAVADTHYHQIVDFDRAGEILTTFGGSGKEPGQFIYPVAVETDPQGNLYVAEYGGNDRIQKFSPAFEFIQEFGSFGSGAGQFQRPSGIVWKAGKLYVVDAFNSRVHVFSDSGEYLELMRVEPVGLHYPYDVASGPAGELHIIEYGAGCLSIVDQQGHITARFGADDPNRRLATPWGLAVNDQGEIWLADTGNRRVVRLRPPGMPIPPRLGHLQAARGQQ